MRKEIDLELFVVASGRVDHALLETRRSMAPSRFDEVKERPSLRGVVWPDTPWVTKLRGRLAPEQMREDLRLVPGERVGLGDRIHDPAFRFPMLAALVAGGIVLVCTWTLRWKGVKKRGPRGRLAVTALVLSWPLLHHDLLAAHRKGQLESGAGASPSAAIGALKTITTSQAIFREGDKDGDGKLEYAPSLADLARYELVDKVLGSGTKQGYLFEVNRGAATPELLWWATADPITPGHPSYFVDQSGEIRGTVVLEKGGHAEADDELLQRRR